MGNPIGEIKNIFIIYSGNKFCILVLWYDPNIKGGLMSLVLCNNQGI